MSFEVFQPGEGPPTIFANVRPWFVGLWGIGCIGTFRRSRVCFVFAMEQSASVNLADATNGELPAVLWSARVSFAFNGSERSCAPSFRMPERFTSDGISSLEITPKGSQSALPEMSSSRDRGKCVWQSIID